MAVAKKARETERKQTSRTHPNANWCVKGVEKVKKWTGGNVNIMHQEPVPEYVRATVRRASRQASERTGTGPDAPPAGTHAEQVLASHSGRFSRRRAQTLPQTKIKILTVGTKMLSATLKEGAGSGPSLTAAGLAVGSAGHGHVSPVLRYSFYR